MIKQSQLEMFKEIASMQVELISSGVLYVITEGNTIVWTVQSKNFEMEVFRVGMTISSSGGAAKAMIEKRTIITKLPASIYGKRLIVTSSPIFDDEGKNIVGAISIAFPRLHPVAAGFSVFAPILSSMFPEGVFIYVTNLEKIICHQGSKKFDLPNRHSGYVLQDADVAYKVIKENKTLSFEVDASRYGVPTYITNAPLYDEDNNEVVGTFGMVIPKGTAGKLREIAHNISENLSQISAAIEELAASANEIYKNEKVLCTGITDIKNDSQQITQVSTLIKDIANHINILGLNADLEAVKAGKVGRGFNIIAQEIRKLSEHSKETVSTIKKFTNNIREKSEEIDEYGKKSMRSSEEQVAATEEICSNIDEIVNLSHVLSDLADNV